MDPDTVWRELLDAVVTHAWDAAAEKAEALTEWLRRDGFPPQLFPHRPLKEAWNRVLARMTCELVLAEAKGRLRRDCCG